MSNWKLEDLISRGWFLADGSRVSRAVVPYAAARKEAGPGTTAASGGSPGNKFGAIRTVAPASWGGTRMADSKATAKLMLQLEARRIAGNIIDFYEEVSIPLGVDEAGKIIRYRADALVLLGYVDDPNGGDPALVIKLVDAKARGMDTRTSATKRAALRKRGLNVEVSI